MIIIRRKSDNVVTHAGDLNLSASGLTGVLWTGSQVNSGATTDTHEVVEVNGLPIPFAGNWYTYDDTNGFQWVSDTARQSQLPDAIATKVADLSRERDAQVNAGVSYTFPDGRVGIIPTEVPNQVSRLTTLYVRAERAERKGESVTFDITTNDDKDFALSPSEMATMGDAATDAGQAVHRKWQEHRDNVLALSDPRDVLAYDTSENGGWP